MALLRPASQFLGCLPLSSGVKLLLWLHLAHAIYTCGMGIFNVTTNNQNIGYGTSANMQVFSAAWSMAGLPIIGMGLWGVHNVIEMPVWFYWYYLSVSATIDTVYLIDLFILRDACVHIQAQMLVDGGRAFACGVARMLSGVSAVVATFAVIYAVYIVWSYLQSLTDTGTSGLIGALLAKQGAQEATIPPERPDFSGDQLGYGAVYTAENFCPKRPHTVLLPKSTFA
mmetsp:Transcript_46924/g.133897  ORF Transcript_46924/g.133897 Transcript_46924/m.133897 type:complete len:227 (+) Transcript_46924:101-781(+)